jgi:protein arginine N-methyltransferase 1
VGENLYSVASYLAMIADQVRMRAYRAALEQAVTPGCVVADIGTGTGIFAILACELGARRVYAIEPDTAIEVARGVASDNGFADRIEFIADRSTSVSVREPADVVVSDVRGILPWYGEAIPTIVDARQRLLADHGKLIPGRDQAWAALAEAENPLGYDSSALDRQLDGIDMSAAARFTPNSWRRVELEPDALRTEPQIWSTLDYPIVTTPRARGAMSWTVDRSCSANAIAAWFSTELVPGIGFSNAPGQPGGIYGQALFPLERPVALDRGDEVTVDIDGVLVAGEYVWRWRTRVTASDGTAKAAFEQSTLGSTPLPLSRLRRREASHQAALGTEGEIDRFVLLSMDGSTPLSDIARCLRSGFPDVFRNDTDALRRVAQLSERYSR